MEQLKMCPWAHSDADHRNLRVVPCGMGWGLTGCIHAMNFPPSLNKQALINRWNDRPGDVAKDETIKTLMGFCERLEGAAGRNFSAYRRENYPNAD